jgi:hypothetical protein
MSQRKSIKVDEIREMVNLALSIPNSSLHMQALGKDREMTPYEAFRLGQISLLERILFDTGNYQGFGYQKGVVTMTEGSAPNLISDETRRTYY